MLDTFDTKSLPIQTNYLWFLTLTFSMVMVLSNWFAIEILGLPFSVKLAQKLKEKEKIDIYDNRTASILHETWKRKIILKFISLI